MLDLIQTRIEQRYDLTRNHRVTEYVVSDPTLARLLGASPESTPEQLLLHEDEEGLAMTLYLAQDLVESNEPLDHNQMAALVEGVSHFTYMAYCARHDRSTTQLELELQGEVDKFFGLADWLAERGHQPEPDLRDLHDQLFQRVSYRSGMDTESRQRYETVNRLAARVCQQWIQRYGNNLGHPGWRTDARRFYRMAQQRKLRHAAGH